MGMAKLVISSAYSDIKTNKLSENMDKFLKETALGIKLLNNEDSGKISFTKTIKLRKEGYSGDIKVTGAKDREFYFHTDGKQIKLYYKVNFNKKEIKLEEITQITIEDNKIFLYQPDFDKSDKSSNNQYRTWVLKDYLI